MQLLFKGIDYLLEGTLREQVAFDSGQCLVRVVVCLLYKTQLLPLLLVEPHCHSVLLLKSLQGLSGNRVKCQKVDGRKMMLRNKLSSLKMAMNYSAAS